MRLYEFVAGLFRFNDGQRRQLEDAGRQMADAFWDGFASRTQDRMRQIARDLTDRVPPQLCVEEDVVLDEPAMNGRDAQYLAEGNGYGDWMKSALNERARACGIENPRKTKRDVLIRKLQKHDASLPQKGSKPTG